jgi:hypothetical protein
LPGPKLNHPGVQRFSAILLSSLANRTSLKRAAYRNRGPAFVAEAKFGLRLIAEVRRLRALVERIQTQRTRRNCGSRMS